MSRHFSYAAVIAVLAATTVLVLADAGVFESAGRWLRARYEAESLLKHPAAAEPGWLRPLVVVLATVLVAWVAVDMSSWMVRGAVVAATALATGFLSLTLALYGMTFNPSPALAACGLAMVMGVLFAETPETRRRREWERLLGGRAGEVTLREWSGHDPTWLAGEIRDVAVVAIRVLDPLPAGAQAGEHLGKVRRLLSEAGAFLRRRRGAVLDIPSGDGARAFFGLVPNAMQGGIEEAAMAALELSRYLREESALQREAGLGGLTCGIGLAVGPLLTGVHGAEAAPFWSASGPAAEQARQLAALNARHRTAVLIGRRAADKLGGHFDLQAVEGDAIFALVAAKAAIPPDEIALDDVVEPDAPAPPAAAPPSSAEDASEVRVPATGRRKFKPGSSSREA